jgi:hypothetical protein
VGHAVVRVELPHHADGLDDIELPIDR